MRMKKGVVAGIFAVILLIPASIFGIKDYSATGTEIKYDDDTIDSSWAFQYRGYAVKFSVGECLWVVDEVNFCGLWKGKNRTFEIEVWDENLNEIARSKKYNFSKYFTSHTDEYVREDDFTWATVDISDVEVTGDFYVVLFENCDDDGHIYVGIDDSGEGKENSFFMLRDPNMTVKRPEYPFYTGPVSWMISARGYEGTVMVANDIDEEYLPVVEQEIKQTYRNPHIKRNSAEEFETYKENRIVIILGGPDAYGGIGETVDNLLSRSEKEYLRTEGNYAMYVKRNVWKEDQTVIILAGSDREMTLEAVKEYREKVLEEIEKAVFG